MKKTGVLISVIVLMFVLSGCDGWLGQTSGNFLSSLKGREMVVSSYADDASLVSRYSGKSVNVTADAKFAITDDKGNTLEKSGVLSISIGGQQVTSVGSTTIFAEKGLVNVIDEYAKTVDITNTDRSTPFINNMVNKMKNFFTGKSAMILIRSQTGKPIATYVGNNVSFFATKIDKSTGIQIDGKYMLIYRANYEIIPLDLLNSDASQ